MEDDLHVEAVTQDWLDERAAIRLAGSRRSLLALMGVVNVGSHFLRDRQMETERAMGLIGHGAWESMVDAGWDVETVMAEADPGMHYTPEGLKNAIDAHVQALDAPVELKFWPTEAEKLRRRKTLATVRYQDEKGIGRGDRIRAIETGKNGEVIGNFRVTATAETIVGHALRAIDALGGRYDIDNTVKLAETLDRMYGDPIDTGTDVKVIVLEPIEVQS